MTLHTHKIHNTLPTGSVFGIDAALIKLLSQVPEIQCAGHKTRLARQLIKHLPSR